MVIINIERKINLLANDVQKFIEERSMSVDNQAKCAWEMAKNLKARLILEDELEDAILAYKDTTDESSHKEEVMYMNLSQAMRDMFLEKGLCINAISKAMKCKYVRVKNVVKKIPDWKTIEIKNKSK